MRIIAVLKACVLLCLVATVGHTESGRIADRWYCGWHGSLLTGTGFGNMDISDWEYYGTGSSEGRLRFELDDLEGMFVMPFYKYGVRFRTPGVQPFLEYGVSVAADPGWMLTAGIVRAFRQSGPHTFFWLLSGTVEEIRYNFGTASSVPGKMSDVDIPGGDLDGSGRLTYEGHGQAVNAGARYEFHWRRIALTADVGASLGFAAAPEFRYDGDTISLDDGSFLKAGTYEVVRDEPKISLTGFYLILTAGYAD